MLLTNLSKSVLVRNFYAEIIHPPHWCPTMKRSFQGYRSFLRSVYTINTSAPTFLLQRNHSWQRKSPKSPEKNRLWRQMKFEISLIFFSFFSFYWQWVKHAKSMLKLDLKKKWKPVLLWVSIILPKRLWMDSRRDSLVLVKLLSFIVCFFVFYKQELVGYTYVQ